MAPLCIHFTNSHAKLWLTLSVLILPSNALFDDLICHSVLHASVILFISWTVVAAPSFAPQMAAGCCASCIASGGGMPHGESSQERKGPSLYDICKMLGIWTSSHFVRISFYVPALFVLKIRIYWAWNYYFSWVPWNLVINLRFVHLQKAGESNFFTQFHATHSK